MSRYINADKLFDILRAYMSFNDVCDLVDNIPTAEVKPIVYAALLVDEDGNMQCSNCGSSECWGNYCMNCGATMKKEKTE